MRSAPTGGGSSRRTVAGGGRIAAAWFGTWGASVEPHPSLLLHADTLCAPGLQVARDWHTPARITVAPGGPAAAVLPLEGRLLVEAGSGSTAATLPLGALGLCGGDLDRVLVARTPASWIGVRIDGALGAGVIAADEIAVVDDPDRLPAVAVQMVNTVLSRPDPPGPMSVAHLKVALTAVLDGAVLSARHRDAHQETGMVASRTGAAPSDALLTIRASADDHAMTLREVAAEFLARRLELSADTD